MSTKNGIMQTVEDEYRRIDWKLYDKHGLNKHGDYAFVFSYPPVRALSSIAEDDLFAPSAFGNLRENANIYLHIPYCSSICSYCYFAKVVEGRSTPVQKKDYPALLQFELERILTHAQAMPQIESIKCTPLSIQLSA